jgi:hypothetical protein
LPEPKRFPHPGKQGFERQISLEAFNRQTPRVVEQHPQAAGRERR